MRMKVLFKWLAMGAIALVVALGALACQEEEAPTTPTARTPTPGVAGPSGWKQVKTDFGVTDKEIIIGQTTALSGSAAAVYSPIPPAMQAYFKKVNQEDGGVCGRQIRFLVEDDQYSPSPALEKAKKLAEQDKVVAFFGNLGTPSVTGQVDYINDPNGDGNPSDGIPHLLVSTGAGKWNNPQKWPWTTSFIPAYPDEGAILATFLNENAEKLVGKPVKDVRVAILYQNDDFGKDGRDGFKQAFKGQIVTEQAYESTAADITSQIANLRAANPDVVYIYATPAFTAQVFKYMYTNNWKPKVIQSYVNPPATLNNLLKDIGGYQAIAGAISTTYILDPVADADRPEVREHKRIMETYGGPPVQQLSLYGQALAETAVAILKIACERGDMTRKGVMEAAESIKGFQPTVLIPGITITMSKTDHRAVQALMPAEIQADGTVKWLLDKPISTER
jgi:branched-chain amino acid transport system substrate-binding protein